MAFATTDGVLGATLRSSSLYGALAQLGEHLLCKQGVIGSIPIGSTIPAAVAVCGWWEAHAERGEMLTDDTPGMKTRYPASGPVKRGVILAASLTL